MYVVYIRTAPKQSRTAKTAFQASIWFFACCWKPQEDLASEQFWGCSPFVQLRFCKAAKAPTCCLSHFPLWISEVSKWNEILQTLLSKSQNTTENADTTENSENWPSKLFAYLCILRLWLSYLVENDDAIVIRTVYNWGSYFYLHSEVVVEKINSISYKWKSVGDLN